MSRRPDQMLAEQEAKVADLRKKADAAIRVADMEEAVLRGMRLMAQRGPETARNDAGMGSLFGASASPEMVKEFQAEVDRVTRRGRQPGAISHQWRDTLRELQLFGPFTVSFAVEVAHRHGLPNVRARDAEERMRSYLALGYVKETAGHYEVTDYFSAKYGFDANKKEAPKAVAFGASE